MIYRGPDDWQAKRNVYARYTFPFSGGRVEPESQNLQRNVTLIVILRHDNVI